MNHNTAEEVILEAALNVMSEQSISKTRVHLIAEKAGMTQSNVHYYFKTKRDILLGLIDKAQDNFAALIDARVKEGASLDDNLAGFFDQKKHIITQDPRYDRMQFDLWGLGQSDEEINKLYAHSYEEWRDRIARVIEEAMPQLPKHKRNLAAAMMVSMMMGASLQYLSNPEAFNLNKYFNYCKEAMLLWLDDQQAEYGAAEK